MFECRKALIALLFTCSSLWSQAQLPLSKTDLQEYRPVFPAIPEQSIFPGQELIVQFTGYNHKGTDLIYDFSWGLDGRIDQSRDEFRWTPSDNHIGNHPIIFTAIDTITMQQVSQPAIITVKPVQYRPAIQIKSNRVIPGGFLNIDEGEDLALVVEAHDLNPADQLILGYYIDRDPKIKLNNARFEVNDRVATFLWTPRDTDAKKKSYSITFYAVDPTGLKAETVLPVLVNDIAHPPIFQTKTREYFIDEGEILTFSVNATDDDGDRLTFKAISKDIKVNDYYFDPGSGKFQWKPTFQDVQKKTTFILVFSASDPMQTVYDTVLVRVDPKNYPPEIERIREKEVKENEELIVRLNVSDKNGDKNLKVSIASSDINGYSFDSEKREFKWTPSYSFVDGADSRKVQVSFRATDGEYQDTKPVSITVWDRNDPREILKAYSKSLTLARALSQDIGSMEYNTRHTLDRKDFWNSFFDITTIAVGAFTGLASSSLASEELQSSAIPLAGAATSLIGIRAVLNKSSDKVVELKNKLVIVKGNIDLSINMMTRDYSENPSLMTTDSYDFQRDFDDFKRRIDQYAVARSKLRTEYSSLPIKEAKKQ